MGRILALDPGSKRIGVAISDPLGIIAHGYPTLERTTRDADGAAIRRLVCEHDVERVIIGLPLALNGSEGPAARKARRLAAMLEEALEIPVELWDERLTTAEAERILIAGEVRPGRRRPHRDRLAATLILQSWLDAHRHGAD